MDNAPPIHVQRAATPSAADQASAERRAAGAALRHAVPRRAQATSPQPGPRDPVDVLIEQGRERMPELLPIRYARMRVSPLAFLRGAAAIMARDLATAPTTGLRVQSCGDCHLFNFGSYVGADGAPVFDINDFDETLRAPFEWDVKRLAVSVVLAGRESGLPERHVRNLATIAAREYREQVAALARLSPMAAWSTRIDLADAIAAIRPKRARRQAEQRLRARLRLSSTQYGLIDAAAGVPRLRDNPPLVFRLPEHDQAIRAAFARYAESLAPERRVLFQRYRLRDATFKVVGVGSVGTFCAIGLFTDADGAPLLLQLKQATTSVLAPFAGASRFANPGERVVVGQRIMQATADPLLGWTSTPEDGRAFYVRQLKDGRLASIGARIERDGLHAYAALCGRALGRAHVRSGDAATLAGYMGSGAAFDRAIAGFAVLYADTSERDFHAFEGAIAAGRIVAAPSS